MKRTTRKILIMAAGVLLTAGLALSQQNNSSEAKLRAAMDKETVDGDLKGAIEIDSPAVGKNQGLAIDLSPDGRTLAVGWLEITPAKLHIGSVSVDGSGFRELHADDHWYGAGILRWTPDGKSILFRREQPGIPHWGVMRIPKEGAATATLIAESHVMTGFDVSPDGSRIVIGDATSSEHLVALDNLLSLVK